VARSTFFAGACRQWGPSAALRRALDFHGVLLPRSRALLSSYVFADFTEWLESHLGIEICFVCTSPAGGTVAARVLVAECEQEQMLERCVLLVD